MNLLEAKMELKHQPKKISFGLMGLEAVILLTVAVFLVELFA